MNRHPRSTPEFLTRKQAADVLGCSEDTIDRRIRAGKLKAVVDDRLVRIAMQDLQAYVRNAKRWRR